eukprot:TRINITY_DN13252_c0_g1_i1.p1 TRINITY_DN13252_c0_g1~~TRINITY_DN13252_c0_g1_i1.p1  ORF type:complete len:604 (+),score=158.66 TRINITY_DN13252_c0_g1_i1:366-2177(+)
MSHIVHLLETTSCPCSVKLGNSNLRRDVTTLPFDYQDVDVPVMEFDASFETSLISEALYLAETAVSQQQKHIEYLEQKAEVRAEEERIRVAEEEARRIALEEQRKRDDEERKRVEEQHRLEQEKIRLLAEEERKRQEEERQRLEEEERKRVEEEERQRKEIERQRLEEEEARRQEEERVRMEEERVMREAEEARKRAEEEERRVLEAKRQTELNQQRQRLQDQSFQMLREQNLQLLAERQGSNPVTTAPSSSIMSPVPATATATATSATIAAAAPGASSVSSNLPAPLIPLGTDGLPSHLYHQSSLSSQSPAPPAAVHNNHVNDSNTLPLVSSFSPPSRDAAPLVSLSDEHIFQHQHQHPQPQSHQLQNQNQNQQQQLPQPPFATMPPPSHAAPFMSHAPTPPFTMPGQSQSQVPPSQQQQQSQQTQQFQGGSNGDASSAERRTRVLENPNNFWRLVQRSADPEIVLIAIDRNQDNGSGTDGVDAADERLLAYVSSFEQLKELGVSNTARIERVMSIYPGDTSNEQRVNCLLSWDTLSSIGCDDAAIEEALTWCAGNIDNAREYLQAYKAVSELGFPNDKIREALLVSSNNVERAVQHLVSES